MVLNLLVTLPASNLPVIYRKVTGKLPVAHTLYVLLNCYFFNRILWPFIILSLWFFCSMCWTVGVIISFQHPSLLYKNIVDIKWPLHGSQIFWKNCVNVTLTEGKHCILTVYCYGLLNRNQNRSFFCETKSTVLYTWNGMAFVHFYFLWSSRKWIIWHQNVEWHVRYNYCKQTMLWRNTLLL